MIRLPFLGTDSAEIQSGPLLIALAVSLFEVLRRYGQRILFFSISVSKLDMFLMFITFLRMTSESSW